jgi:hypothetical protein
VEDFQSWAGYWFAKWQASGYRDTRSHRKYLANYMAANEQKGKANHGSK